MRTEEDATRIMDSSLTKRDGKLGRDINKLWRKARSLYADEGSSRLELVCENIDVLSLEGIRSCIDILGFQQEIEEAAANQKRMKIMQFIYEMTRLLLPSVMIISVSLAILAFAFDTFPGDRVKPFIQLWQEGFHGVMFVVPLPFLVVFVCIVLLGYVTLSLMLNVWNRATYKESTEFARKLQTITEQLLAFKQQSDLKEQKATEQIVTAIKTAVQEVMAQQKSLADAASIDTFQGTVQPVINTLESRLTAMTGQLSAALLQTVRGVSVDALSAVVAASKASITNHVGVLEDTINTSREAVEAANKAIVDSNNRTSSLYDAFTPLVSQLKSDMSTFRTELQRYQERLSALTFASQRVADASGGLIANAGSYESTGKLLNENIAKLTQVQGEVAEKMQTVTDHIGELEGKIEGTTSALARTATSLKEFADTLGSSFGQMDKRVEGIMSGVLTKVEESMHRFVSATEGSMKLTEEAMQRFVSDTDQNMKLTSENIRDATSSLAEVGPGLHSAADTLRQVVNEFSKLEGLANEFSKLQGLAGGVSKLQNTVEALQQVAKEFSKSGRKGMP